MNELINALINREGKPAFLPKNKAVSVQSLRRAIHEMASVENAKVPAERQVTRRDIETVAARSLNKTASLERSSRFFAAYRDVASFISLAIHGNAPVHAAQNTDLLPVGHPLSTRKHSMTASAYSAAVARWIAADPRIDNSVRALVADAFMYSVNSIQAQHANARLASLAPGLVPQEFIINTELTPIVAALGDGNSSAARSARSRLQRRDRNGQWAEQGGGIQFYLRLPDGTVTSVIGKFVGNSKDGNSFEVEVRNDNNLKNGIYEVPTQKAAALKAVLPEGIVDQPTDVQDTGDIEPVDLNDIVSVDVPNGWELVSEKKEGEKGPDKVFKSADGYRVDYYEPGNPDIPADVQKAWKAQTGLFGAKLSNPPATKNAAGDTSFGAKFDKNEPVVILWRDKTDLTPEKSILIGQNWSDAQEYAEKDEKSFDEDYKKAAKQKEAYDKSAAESKAKLEADKAKDEERKKKNAEVAANIRKNLNNGLDPFGNKIPAGWTAITDDIALNPPYGDVDPSKAVSYRRKEQGFTGTLSHTPDGKLKGFYMEQEFDNWDDAEAGFVENVEADVNARRSKVLDLIEPYDPSGEVREMIENGANGDEVLEKLRENKSWKSQEDDLDTSWAVDLPSPGQKKGWKEFEEKRKAIADLPKEFEEITTPETDAITLAKPANQVQVGETIINKEGNQGTVTKVDTSSSVPRIFTDADSTENGRFYKSDEIVELAKAEKPQEETKEEVKLPASKAKLEKPAKEEKPAPQKSEPSDIEWVLPDGAFKLYRADEFEPDGYSGQDSPDYTDDPKVLANRFSEEFLKVALAEALIGVDNYVNEFIEQLDKIPDIDEGDGKPGPKKGQKAEKAEKKKKIKQASGFGQLEFSEGEEYVPAEALYVALKEKGEDADMIVAEIYDLGLGFEAKNVDMLNDLRSPEEVKSQEPSVLIDEFDKDTMDIVADNERLARPDVAAVAVAQIEEAIANGEDNQLIVDIANDINALESNADLVSFLGQYIGWALNGSPEEKQAFRGLWGLLISADGGYSRKGLTDSMLFKAVANAMKAYNGSKPSVAEVDAVFEEFGYFPDLIRSKGAVIDGTETLSMQDSFAGAMFRLIASMAKPNNVMLHRGIQIPLDLTDELDRFVEGAVISLDPRSFSDDKALAGKFAGALGTSQGAAAVIFNLPAGKGKVADISKISMFALEREQLAFGNFKIVGVRKKVNPNGKLVINVDIEMLDKRGQVLEGYDDDYAPLLTSNDDVELPDGYYSQSSEPYVVTDEKGKGVPEGFDDSPLYIAQMWATEDLIEVFRSGIEDGTGKALLIYPIGDGYEAAIDVEAIRDALQIQGIDTNEILKDIANADADAEASDEEQEGVEAESEGTVAELADDIGTEYDMEGWKQVGEQLGSNKGGFYEDAEGNRYYVKEPKSDLHAQNEALASAFYRALGIDAAEIYIGSANDGKKKTYSPDIKDSKQDLEEKLNDPEYLAKLQEGFAVDAWLANWDVAGLVFDNVMSDGDGNPVRVDPGGALLFRAMGAPKGQLFGNEANELDSLRDPKMNPQSAKIFGSMTEEQQKESARKLLDISHTDIDALVDSVITDEEKAQELKDKLKARRNFILERYGLLGDDTSLIAETTKVEDEEEKAEGETPVAEGVTPKPEVPSESVTNPYTTSDGVPIEPGMKLRYKKTKEVVEFVKYDKGNSSYVFVKLPDGTIKVKSTKQLESIKDDGDSDGDGGGGGDKKSPEPDKPSTPEVTPEGDKPVDVEGPEVTVQSSPTKIDTSGTVEDALNQVKAAIEKNETITFFYNGKARTFKPMSVWENPKNGKINVYGEDLGDEGKKKNFTLQLMENFDSYKPEVVEAAQPEAAPEKKKLQGHAQWIQELAAQQGKIITDEQAIEIRDIIDENGLLGMNWSAAEDSDIIEAIAEAVGADFSGLGEGDSDVDPETLPEQTEKVEDVTEAQVEKPVVQDPYAPGAEITDKKGKKGTILKGPNVDNYVFVKFEDGKTGWRSVNAISTTGEFDPSIKASPKPTAGKITPAGTTAVFVENPAGWDTSDFEDVPPLTDAIALVQNPDDKSAAMRGASAAIDADSIEDLDVRIMRVRDAAGTDGLRLKFKLTAWAGNAKAKELLSFQSEADLDKIAEQLGLAKFERTKLKIDRIDIGPDGVGQISSTTNGYQGEGYTFTLTTKDGIVIKINRANYDATSKVKVSKYGNPASFHNLVQIQAPADATNEQIADALRIAGVADVRPATKADAQILVENRLMSIFDGKVDATKNPKGQDRIDSLDRIKSKYGITVDDVVITTGASGRIETRLSPEGAAKIVKATGEPTAIKHKISTPGFYGSEDSMDKTAEWYANLLGTPQGGLLSTTTRWTEGVGMSGQSSDADVGTGGADYVFTTPVKVADAKTFGTTGMVMYFDPVKTYQRLDFYANYGDAFGKRQANQDIISAAKVGAYEVMFKHRLSFDDLDSVVVSTQAMRTAIITKLRQKGITEIGGRPLEAVIIVGSKVTA